LLGQTGKYDVVITEIGGTVGDIESLPYIETVRQLRWELEKDSLVIHLTLLPLLKTTGELKTKPTQHSVKELLSAGIQPDILVCRSELPITEDIRKKLALFCNIKKDAVIESLDAETIYDVPLLMQDEKLDHVVLDRLGMGLHEEPELKKWKEFLSRLKKPKSHVKIGLVGKYVELKDSYKSIVESFIHAGAVNETKVDIDWIHSENIFPENVADVLSDLDGLLVAPGFGERGIEGKIEAIKYVRENHIPFLGICLGMQCAVVEYGRNVLGLEDCHSAEFHGNASSKVIDLMEDQKNVSAKGGTMRLGAYNCAITPGSLANNIYGRDLIRERHRHRFEFNDSYKEQYEKAGMIASGINPDSDLTEIVEIPEHPWFVGVQFHPEYKSTVTNPHPLFVAFVKAAVTHKQ
jgi:CTP synthase